MKESLLKQGNHIILYGKKIHELNKSPDDNVINLIAMGNNIHKGISSDKTIKITKDEIKELIKQYKIMRKLLETWPRRKIMMSYEKEWNLKREAFFKKHPKITKLYKPNSQ